MKNKKLFKYIPITIMTAGVILAAFVNPPYFLNNSGTSGTQVFNDNQQVNDADYADQLDYIRSDVTKQDGVTNSVKSIKLASTKSPISYSTAAIVTKMDGSTLLYTWGRNDYGQLGLGNEDSTPTPKRVPSFGSSPITQIIFGFLHSAVLLEDGSLYTWGYNARGQLGLGDETDRPTPIRVPSFGSSPITQIGIGGYHSAALLENGTLYIWGLNDTSQLGLGDGSDIEILTPTPVPSFGSSPITQIVLGNNHSAVLLKDGSLYTWGNNSYGQLGLGDTIGDTVSTPKRVPSFGSSSITQIVLGYSHSAALLEGGTLYTWGNNSSGQLGLDDKTKISTPKRVPSFGSSPITQIGIGAYHSAALLEDGSLYTWGANSYGQLGLSNIDATLTPAQVLSLNGKKITQIAFGYYHSAALLEDGSLYTWGRNNYGQLGLGNTGGFVFTPTWMPYLGKDSHITAKDTITAKKAVDSFWVDGVLNQVEFKKSFNLINIPDGVDQEIAMDTKPTYNNAGTVTMKVKFKYFYDENGSVVTDTSTTAMMISGFKPYTIITNITALSKYPHDVVVDKWMQAVTVDNKLNYDELKKYLDLSTVPMTAKFEIRNENRNSKTGVLTFDIITSQVIDNNNDIINTPNDFPPFPITLKLTERITRMTAKEASASSLTAAELRAKLFNEDGLVKDRIELENYMSVVAPVDDVKYYLIANSWVFNPADGTLAFTIYADKYYDGEGNEQPGSVVNVDSQLSLNLSLQPEASRIAIKPNMPDVRVDQFEAYVKNNTSTVVRSKLEEFLILTNVPNDATFAINDVKIDDYNDNFESNHLKFKLTIDKFNQDIPVTPQPYSKDLGLTLSTQHAPTRMKVKPRYDNNFPVNKFFPFFVGADDSVTNYGFLTQFVELQSVPNDAILTVKEKSPDETTGKVSFKLITSSAYDISSNPIDYFETLIELTLGKKPQATMIAANPDIISPERVDRFATEINKLTSADLKNYLFPKYLTLTGELPADALFSVTDIMTTESTGEITFNLWATTAYNNDGDIKNNDCVNLSLNLGIKYLTTNVIANTSITDPERVDVVKTQLENLTDAALLTYLVPKYLKITGDVPTNTTVKATDISITGLTGAISFNLVLSSAYDVNSDVINNKVFAINLMAGIKHLPTSLVEKTYDNTQRVDQVAKKLTQTGTALKTYLEQFMVFNSVPEETIITVENIKTQETTGEINFDVVLNQYYDENSDLIPAPFQSHFDLMLGIKHAPTTINLKTSYKQNVRIDKFIGNINGLEAQSLHDYLAQDYLDINSLVDVNKIKASVVESNYDNGTLKLKVEVPSYYDANSELIDQSKHFSFDLILIPKYTPTTISVASTYKKDLTPTKFIQQIDPLASIITDATYNLSDANIGFLSKFINFTSVPMQTSYTLTLNSALSSDETGQLNFKLSLNQHYNGDGDLVSSEYSQDLALNIATINKIPSKTAFTRKSDAPLVDSEAQFRKMVYHTENIINMEELAKFVEGLDTLPSTAKIQRVILKSADQGILVVGLEVSSYYDGEKADAIEVQKTFSFDVIMKDQVGPTKSAGFEWWWIVIAVGGATIIGLIIWLVIKKNKQSKELKNENNVS